MLIWHIFVFEGMQTKNNIQVSIGIICGLLLFLSMHLTAQKTISTEEYIQTYKDIAIKKMEEYRIPASITLAQGILESGSGNSKLARKANNHFGIKCHKEWNGKTFYADDDVAHECFRKYKKAADSYHDHSLFLSQRGRYSFLFDYKTDDYVSWAKGLKKAGYATNPRYPELLIRIIEKNKLYQYDKKISGKPSQANPPGSNTDLVKLKKVGESDAGRAIYENNGKKLILIEKGDTFNKLASEFGMYTGQFLRYNEVERDHILQIGEWVYLQKKKRSPEKKYKTHLVKQGETIREISQLYGIRSNILRKRNNLPDGIQVPVNTRLKLR